MARGLTILIAEDNPADRMLLSAIVSRQGHRVLTAGNGLEAVAMFEQERPQLVLLDALMPVMDGFDAARRIKTLAGDELVPIIFLTSLTENEALVKCLDAGGDDFVAKPYNPIILEAKIHAMGRLRQLQATVLEQRDLIARQNRQLLDEQRQAKAIFDKVAHAGCLAAPNIRYLQSPLALFNGDLLLAAQAPTGSMFVLLGDFTGHGLPAAIGAMPLAETFYGMTAKGYSSQDIVRELNTKLKRILPVGVFCCATLLDINLAQRILQVWAGGLPDGYLIRSAEGGHVALRSRHLPLGVLDAQVFDDRFESYSLTLGDRLLLVSDGVVESRNPQGELFGEERLLALIASRDPSSLFDETRAALMAFHGELQDDLSMVEVHLVEGVENGILPAAPAPSGTLQPSPLDWSASFELRAESLRDYNPLPLLLQLLLQVQPLRPQAGTISTVLAELYSNALEHGVLGLDSFLKSDAQGFARYYELRQQRLQALEAGHVRFHFQLQPTPDGGRLCITVEDSGGGFDAARVCALRYDTKGLAGRGLRLVEELSDRCEWGADGRSVHVEFSWSLGA
ncbi:ATP-binding SpoIIE family protein phosphatase [Stutzerimonas azotifigens]|uniref:Fused response regulator/phosphatase n=1 Tax=Stutzerimonas azotifigens TaxID=291995 RepID=A0ABR5YXX0_9GAMM|nr:fused response regulator/phosphatase [Stutzerimonas azotifigens]MBA1272798.1 fused response regulator/phosphatase [Stutzerimonas azotifigens]